MGIDACKHLFKHTNLFSMPSLQQELGKRVGKGQAREAGRGSRPSAGRRQSRRRCRRGGGRPRAAAGQRPPARPPATPDPTQTAPSSRTPGSHTCTGATLCITAARCISNRQMPPSITSNTHFHISLTHICRDTNLLGCQEAGQGRRRG